jgi:hypothetical protein
MGSVASERKRLHRDLFEIGGASDTCGDNDDDFSCRTDLTTVKASNVRLDTVRSAPHVAIDGKSPGRAAATIQFFGYMHISHTAQTACSCIPFRATADLEDLIENLLVPVDRTLHRLLLEYVSLFVFGDCRTTGERERKRGCDRITKILM